MELIKTKEASKLLGVTETHLRAALQQGLYDFGVAVKNKSGRYTYTIYRSKLEKYIASQYCV